MRRILAVVAMSRNGVIGRNGGLPWHVATDLRRFKEITMGKPVIMGRKTWDSLPKKPLPGRHNIVITRQRDFRAPGATVVGDMGQALAAAGAQSELAVIGGGEIFALFLPMTDRIYLTEVDLDADGDTRFPALDPAEWQETARERHEKGPRDDAPFILRILDRVRPSRSASMDNPGTAPYIDA